MASPLGGARPPVAASAVPTDRAEPGAPVGARAAEVAPAPAGTVEERLFAEGFGFDFFQAVRLLERLFPQRRAVGRPNPPATEIVRFRAHQSLAFPASTIYDLARGDGDGAAVMEVAFMGLTGPNGVLPRHYTELLMRLAREVKGPERYALRDWFDQFNHRFIALFYRAWEKYRFYIPYERGEYARPEPDPFTRSLFSLVGLGVPQLRNRLRVSVWDAVADPPRERVLAKIDDLALLHYSGLFAHRPRNAVSLEALLHDFFQLPVQVVQFQGQWLRLDAGNQTRMGVGNNRLGVDVVAGERVWDVQSKFRVRLGPLGLARFTEFLPDRSPGGTRKAFFLLCHLVRLYVGPEFDFEVQLVLRAADVPECQLSADGAIEPRLGWNTWVRSRPFPRNADEGVFAAEEPVWLDAGPPAFVER